MTQPAEALLTPDPSERAQLKSRSQEDSDLLQTLLGYFHEAKEARESGPADRDNNWLANWRAYWSHYDTTKKAKWQATEQMPEVPTFVERFVAGMRQALVRAGQWFTITDPIEGQTKVTKLIEKVITAQLKRSGRNATGQKIGFSHEFGQIIKSGTLMAQCASVGWEDGSIRIQAVDPRDIWLDPTGRGLYRVRRKMIDRHTLKNEKDSAAKPLYIQEAVERLSPDYQDEDKGPKEESAGHTQEVSSSRKPVEILEFLCDVLDADGEELQKNRLISVGNRREILRNEPNPFWHGRDWIVYAPMISVPFSVYGRTYVESFRQLANTFTEMTNLLLDSIHTTSMKAFMAWPEMLEDATQLSEGVTPNKVFIASEDSQPGDSFIEAIELGRTPAEAFSMLQALKSELQEGASQSELSVGKLPSAGDHTAREIEEASSGSRALVGSIASDTEEQVLDVILDLVWWTTLQHIDPEQDPEIASELGPEIVSMLIAQREQFRGKRFRMKANGLTGILERGNRLRGTMGFLNIIGSNELLAQAFLKDHSLSKLIRELVMDFGIDASRIEKDEQERDAETQLAARAAATAVDPGAGGTPGPGGGGGAAPAAVEPLPPTAPGPETPL